MSALTLSLSLGQCATLACLLEASAPKAGNVHRSADFEDLSLYDFLASAVAIAPAIEAATIAGVGRTVLDAIVATRRVVATNTNLGIVLLLAPLAAVPRAISLAPPVVHEVLSGLGPGDCRDVYEAIRLAAPGGLGKVKEMDIAAEPTADLLLAMHAAADRDLVARQYADDFRLVLDEALPLLVAGQTAGWPLSEAIIRTHLELLSRYADSLIARKCGADAARQISARAAAVLATGQPGDEEYFQALADFDFFLRADGHRRNPGTTADLIAAALFAGLRDETIRPPYR
jgi:triphosphoribosyl-dephospho-CoA synthase